jgi:hypothetical protein
MFECMERVAATSYGFVGVKNSAVETLMHPHIATILYDMHGVQCHDFTLTYLFT